MKSERGVTLTSLIIYIIAMVIVVGAIATLTSYFYGNLDRLSTRTDGSKEYTAFSSYFTKDINERGNGVYSCSAKQIVFTNGNQYTIQEGGIYFNKIQICEDVDVSDSRFIWDNDKKITASLKLAGETYSNEYKLLDEIEGPSGPTVADIGDYVNYGVNLDISSNNAANGTNWTTDWRIFYVDEETGGTYIIASDYLNNSLLPSATNMGTQSGYTFSAYWPSTSNLTRAGASAIDSNIAGANKTFELSWLNDNSSSTNGNAKAVAALLDTSAWESFLTDSVKAKNAKAVGGPTLELYTASWNAKGYTQLYTDYNSIGYYVGVEATPSSYASQNNAAKGGYYVNMSQVDTAGYGDTLYYPHQSSVSNCSAYWLTSPSANGGCVMVMRFNGLVYYGHYSDKSLGLRPVVYLPSTVSWTESNNVWTVSQ